jgi:hypothetical protein
VYKTDKYGYVNTAIGMVSSLQTPVFIGGVIGSKHCSISFYFSLIFLWKISIEMQMWSLMQFKTIVKLIKVRKTQKEKLYFLFA